MKRLNFSAVVFLLGGTLALSACGDGESGAANAEGSGAVDEVQGGSISDGMLPLESVTSKAPTRGGSDEGGSDEGGSDESGSDEGGSDEGVGAEAAAGS